MSTLLLVCLLVALATTRGLLLSPKMHIMANKVSASRLSSQSEDSLSVDNAAINLKVQSEDSNTQSIFSKGKKYMNAAMLGLALFSSAPLPMNMNSIQPAHAAGQTSTASLETSIAALETANGKTEVVQALADVFEAAESKTLLVRTKYKTRIIKAVNSRRANVGNEWDNVLGYESGELKRRVDPFRTVDLKPYLDVAPFVGGALYLATLFVQVQLPELFVFAYPAAALAFFIPAIAIVVFN